MGKSNPQKATSIKRRPANAAFLSVDSFAPTGGTTLAQVIALIQVYTHVDPILATYSVGPLVPDLDLLGADINSHWNLAGHQRFFQNEIDPSWTIIYLASYVDLKIAATP